MGDRGNIVIKQHPFQKEPQFIFCYTHSTGSALPGIVRRALQDAQSRWNDEQYFTRIVFDTLTDGDRGTLGYGLTTYLCDNEHPLVVLDCDKQTVSYYRESDADNNFAGGAVHVWTFKDFIDPSMTDDIVTAWANAHGAQDAPADPFDLP